MKNKLPDYWEPGWYKLFASVKTVDGELRPGVVIIEATIHVGSSIIGQKLLGSYYLGRFKLARKERLITIKFDKPVQEFSLVNIDLDYRMQYRTGHSNYNIVRDLYPDGHVQLRLKEVVKNG